MENKVFSKTQYNVYYMLRLKANHILYVFNNTSLQFDREDCMNDNCEHRYSKLEELMHDFCSLSFKEFEECTTGYIEVIRLEEIFTRESKDEDFTLTDGDIKCVFWLNLPMYLEIGD